MPGDSQARDDGSAASRGGPGTATTASAATALVLAGRRAAAGFGGADHPHKAFMDLGGRPMIDRVLDALSASRSVERVVVSIDDPELIRDRTSSGAVEHHASDVSPAASVASFLEAAPAGERVLVTTADHALLTAQAVDDFLAEEAAARADVTAAVVPASVFRLRYPDARRTFIGLRDDGFTGANLFAFRCPDGARAAQFWRRAELHRKKPWRLAGVFGLGALVRFASGRLTLDEALERVGAAAGVSVHAVRLSDADLAIDVDSPRDAELVSRLLAARAANG